MNDIEEEIQLREIRLFKVEFYKCSLNHYLIMMMAQTVMICFINWMLVSQLSGVVQFLVFQYFLIVFCSMASWFVTLMCYVRIKRLQNQLTIVTLEL